MRTLRSYLRAIAGIIDKPTKSKSKVNQMAEGKAKKQPFRKSDLGYYEDESGYEALLTAYQEKKGK